MPVPLAPHWFKSSYSGGSGTECVECAPGDGSTLVRDSKKPHAPVVVIGSHAWQAFVRAVGAGLLER
ncbi:hypothetical protein GCM10010317_079800 [Streptomyces mirabilis]|uniref:DUF397 domain-containing protein n=1 Tax=Streptomyces TaxID=1883 RepID=UPI00167DFD16|nr:MULTISPECIES: DUF397 domain-containing protein [Streptomyces]GHD71278.1 hypothetical protein GCM10010317_079800 [Streptomyces mirabilis]